MIINANYITGESNSKPKTKIYIVNPEVSAIESEALEILNIYGKTTFNFTPNDLITKVYHMALKEYESLHLAFGAIYTLGYVHGKELSVSAGKLNHASRKVNNYKGIGRYFKKRTKTY